MTSINSNITSTIASNISNLRLKTAQNTFQRASKPIAKEEEIINQRVKSEEEIAFENPFKGRFSNSQIEEMKDISRSMGENLTNEDIQYALKYGRSVIADYSV